jgi:hypothetical protein
MGEYEVFLSIEEMGLEDGLVVQNMRHGGTMKSRKRKRRKKKTK